MSLSWPMGAQREYELTVEKLKRQETTILGPDDLVVGADWDTTDKWCYLTILRRLRPNSGGDE